MSEFLFYIKWLAWTLGMIGAAAVGFTIAMLLVELGIIRVEERGE